MITRRLKKIYDADKEKEEEYAEVEDVEDEAEVKENEKLQKEEDPVSPSAV